MINSEKREEILLCSQKIPFYLTVGIKKAFISTKYPSDCSSPVLKEYAPSFSSDVHKIIGRFLRDLEISSRAHHPLIKPEFCDEFCRGSAGIFTDKKYPHPRSNSILGGSSSGAVYNLLLGQTDISICSDTGGSARFPVLCGDNSLVGFKPSYGLISKNGLIEYVGDLDTVSLMSSTKNFNLLQIFFDVLTEDNSIEIKKDFRITTINYDKKELKDSPLFRLYNNPLLEQYYNIKSMLYCWSNTHRYDGKRFSSYQNTYPSSFKPNPSFLENGEIKRVRQLSFNKLNACSLRLEQISRKVQKIINQIITLFSKDNIFLLRRFKGISTYISDTDGMTDDKGLKLFIENLTGLPAIMVPAGRNEYFQITGPPNSDKLLLNKESLNKIISKFTAKS